MNVDPPYSDAEWCIAEQALRERRGYQPNEHVDPWDIEDECAERRIDADGPYERWRDAAASVPSEGGL